LFELALLSPEVVLVFWIVGLGLLLLYPVSLVWTYREAESRSRNGLLATLLVAVTWPVGRAVWLVMRPSVGKRAA
jgi:hypothetical protein